MRPSTATHIRDFIVCAVAALFVQFLVLNYVEMFVTTPEAEAKGRVRGEYERSMNDPCLVGPGEGSEACADHLCRSENGRLYCRTARDDPSSAVSVDDRAAWLEEHAPKGWSTSDRQTYTISFVLIGALTAKFFLLPPMPENVDEEYLAERN